MLLEWRSYWVRQQHEDVCIDGRSKCWTTAKNVQGVGFLTKVHLPSIHAQQLQCGTGSTRQLSLLEAIMNWAGAAVSHQVAPASGVADDF
jgi:hypothetical protein